MKPFAFRQGARDMSEMCGVSAKTDGCLPVLHGSLELKT